MSNVEQLEYRVRGLNPDELRAFRDWFASFDAEAWDQQIEADSNRGVLDSHAIRALAEHDEGRSTPL